MSDHRASTKLILLAGLFSLLFGCADAPKKVLVKPAKPSAESLQLNQASALQAMGDFSAAAALYEQLATDSKPPRRDELWVRAASAYFQASDTASATAALARAERQFLSPPFAFLARLIDAELLMAETNMDAAWDLLAAPAPIGASMPMLTRYRQLRAEILRLRGDFLAGAQELGILDRLLGDHQARLDNQMRILRTLSNLSEEALLAQLPSQPSVFGGWMELALALRPQTEETSPSRINFSQWRAAHPNHPALPDLFDAYLAKMKSLVAEYEQIAILLPASGRYAKVAAVLQEGLMNAYYAMDESKRPRLAFYDTSNSNDIWPLLQQAIADGAGAAIGPLQKEAVQQLAQAGELEIPVLALNRVKLDSAPAANFFQFGLAPEDEAAQAADKAWRDGATNALVMIPDTDWGHRLLESFRQRWEELGGAVVEHQTYDPKLNDFSDPIRKLLNLDESKQRQQALVRQLGQSLEFQPRRRHDAGALFLAANARKARALWPQLQFHRAGDIPTYTTSHVHSGPFQTPRDLDLVGLMFTDIPWLLKPEVADDRLPEEIPRRQGTLARLYALGMDSYRLLGELPRLKEFPTSSSSGATGDLSLDEINQVHRHLIWARISAGGIELIDPPETTADEQETPQEAGETSPIPPADSQAKPPPHVSAR